MMNSQAVYSDKSLIARARAGDRGAFGELVRLHSHRVYGMSFEDPERTARTRRTICKMSLQSVWQDPPIRRELSILDMVDPDRNQ